MAIVQRKEAKICIKDMTLQLKGQENGQEEPYKTLIRSGIKCP